MVGHVSAVPSLLESNHMKRMGTTAALDTDSHKRAGWQRHSGGTP